jgi:hypothetical protein
VDDDIVQSATAEYAQRVHEAATSADLFAAEATRRWQEVASRVDIDPSDCTTHAELCIRSDALSPRSVDVHESCRQVRFLFWSWTECGKGYVGYLDNLDTQAPKRDYQFIHEGKSNGCGPSSGAAMLWWWAERGGFDTIDSDRRPQWSQYQDAAYERAARQLVSDMEAFGKILWFDLPEGQRATWPHKYTSGLQKYLDRRGQPLRARDAWGWAPLGTGTALQRLISAFDRATPTPIVALEGSISVQHYGVAKGFRKDAFGGLRADLLTPLGARTTLNLDGFFNIAGVYWIEPK